MTTLTKLTKRLTGRLNAMALVVVASLITTTAFTQQHYETFDNGKYDMWRVQGGKTSTLSTNYSASGSYSFRAYLKAEVNSNPRHEIVFKGNSNIPHNQKMFNTYGVQFAMYVPSNFNVNDHSNEIVFQYHSEKDDHDSYTNPFFALQIADDDFRVLTRWIKRDPGTDNDKVTTTYSNIANIVPGKWHYFVVDINWDYRSSGNGFAKVYMKVGSPPSQSDLKVNHQGPIGSKDALGPYLKFGIYKFDWSDSYYVNKAKSDGIYYREYYFDNILQKQGGILSGSSSGSTSSGSTADLGVSAGADFNVPLENENFRPEATWNSNVNVTKVQWRQITDMNVYESNMDNWKCIISSIKVGEYIYEVEITDDKGNKDTDRVKVIVYDGTPPSTSTSSGSGTTSSGGLSVSAGADFNVHVDQENFRPEASWDDSHNVTKVQWRQITNMNVYESNMDNWKCIISSIKVGEYIYEVQITDDKGNKATDQVKVIVYDGNPPSTSTSTSGSGTTSSGGLSVSAGADFNVHVDEENFRPEASWDDSHNVTKVQWRQITNMNVYESNMDNWKCIISSIKVGEYIYEVQITDDKGNKATDQIKVIVYDGNPPSTSTSTSGSGTTSSGGLSVSAGADFNVHVNDENFRPEASWDDSHNVTKVQWKQITNMNVYESNMDNWKCIISSIKVGEYIYEVQITDDKGNQATDRVKVIVYEGSAPPSSSSGSTSGSGISVYAGADMSVPVAQENFRPEATWDSNINVTKVQWTQITNMNVYESKMDNWKCIISSIKVGNYTYEVEITDDKGNKATDRINIVVYDGPSSSMNLSDEFDDFTQQEFTMGLTRNFVTGDTGLKLIDQQFATDTYLQIMNINGQSLQSSYNDGFLNTYSLSPGVYIYNVVNPDGELVQKGRIIRR